MRLERVCSEYIYKTCKEVGIADVNYVFVAKSKVKNAIFQNHMDVMKEEMKTKKKMKEVQEDDFTIEHQVNSSRKNSLQNKMPNGNRNPR